MSPEQWRGDAIGPASDQYSLGVMLYELLTGRTPFSGTLFELLQAHANQAPPSIRDVRPDVDPALEAIITIMLAKKEQERFPSLRDVSKALASLAPRRSQAAERQAIMSAVAPELLETSPTPEVVNATTAKIPPSPPTDAVVETVPAAAQDTPVGAEGRGRNKQLVAVVVALVVIAAVGYVLASRTSSTKTASEPPPPTQAAKTDSVVPTKTDSVSVAKPETTLVRADTATPSKRDSATKAPPPVVVPQPAPAPVTAPPKTAPKRDSIRPTRPDSIAARCAAINLKLSLGEEVSRADSTYLRRECTRTRP